MKINRNKGNLQNQLQKMLQAGMENVDTTTSQNNDNAWPDNNTLRTTGQSRKEQTTTENSKDEAVTDSRKAEPKNNAPRPATRKAEKRQQPATTPVPEGQRLNAAQRHEVPDRNAKYAGEPIKSVGCRMPQSLYARMLQYKAMNDTQLNRITLNDIIIDAVDAFLEARQ